jgi:hypothetical protein
MDKAYIPLKLAICKLEQEAEQPNIQLKLLNHNQQNSLYLDQFKFVLLFS